MNAFPSNSPFKLLNPYEKGDAGIYFGRENETRRLAEALMRSKFMLLYGASGTGKTSLIQCGLQGMFSPRDWLPIFVRRGNNFIESLRDEVLEQYRSRYRLRYPGKEPALPNDLTLRDAVKRLFNIAYVPVYLILDQFEEIFTLGKEPEQQAFFQALAELQLFEEDLFCKLLIVTREEYIAHFYRYEKELPFLFEYRFRVEKMRHEQLQQVVEGSLQAPYAGYPAFQIGAGASNRILENLTDERGEIDLTTLQVYLDRLYQEDLERAPKAGRHHIFFDTALVGGNKLHNVLSDFLDRQTDIVGARLFPKRSGDAGGKNLALQVLFKLVTAQGTKQNCSATEVYEELTKGRQALQQDTVLRILDALAGPDIRILNRLRFAKTDEERFEIVHDRLAEQVFAKFNAEEISQREAQTTIENKQKRYVETKEYLSRGELELVDKSLNIGRLDAHLQEFHTQSIAYHKRRERRQRLVTAGALAAAVVFGMVAVYAYRQTLLAEASRKEAKESAEDAKEKQELASFNSLMANKQRLLADSSAVKAQQAKETAVEALAEARGNAKVAVNVLLTQARNAIYHLNYEEALLSLNAAASLGQRKLDVARALLEIAFLNIESGKKQAATVDIIKKASALYGKTNRLSDLQTFNRRNLNHYLCWLDAERYNTLLSRYYPVMINIKGSKEFSMGCLGDKGCVGNKNIYRVQVSDYLLASTEITFWQWGLYCASIGIQLHNFSPEWGIDGDNPAVKITWYDAIKYTNWLSNQFNLDSVYETRHNERLVGDETKYYSDLFNATINPEANGFRLPSEAEWEYAARGATTLDSFFQHVSGSEILKLGWCSDNCDSLGVQRTRPVSTRVPIKCNKNRLYDMNGNVFEWCWDLLDNYPSKLSANPSGSLSVKFGKIKRGGSFLNNSASITQVTFRYVDEIKSYIREKDMGFRVAQKKQ